MTNEPIENDEPTLLFWRETSAGKRGLACRLEYCENPECACEEAFVQAFEVDEHFERLVTRGTQVEILSRKGGKSSSNLGRVSAVVDLKRGKISKDDDASPTSPRQEELFGWLKEELDDDTREEIRRRWKLFKEERKQEVEAFAREPWKKADWTLWDGQKPVAWQDVVGAVRQPMLVVEKHSYKGVDCYCIRPGCDCNDVSIQFYRIEDGEYDEMLGEVFVEASSGHVTGLGNAPGHFHTMLALWSAFESRNDLGELTRRFQEMTRIGPQIHALRRQQMRRKKNSPRAVGRNAPCPCGSGKKYKKCCGA